MVVLVLRLVAGVVAVASGLITGSMAMQVYQNPQAANGIMLAGLVIVAITCLFSIGFLAAGVWPVLRRLVPSRPHHR
jgi:hypothetical protein